MGRLDERTPERSISDYRYVVLSHHAHHGEETNCFSNKMEILIKKTRSNLEGTRWFFIKERNRRPNSVQEET
jgi:hypothetical protein